MDRFLDEAELAGRQRLERREDSSSSAPKHANEAVRPGVQREALNARSVLALQRSIGNAGTTAYLQREETEEDGGRSPIHDVVGSGGSALDDGTRNTMERHLGADLSDVRLHVDRGSAESVSAAAYTVGNDVVVHPDHFSPGTPAAQRTLAHELTHVVQQRSGPVEGTARAGGIKVSDPSDRFEQEAERNAERFSSSTPSQSAAPAAASVQTMSVQREAGEDEAEVQELPIQREAEEDEEEGSE